MLLLKVPLLFSSASCSALYLLRYVVIDGTFCSSAGRRLLGAVSLATLYSLLLTCNQVICPRPPAALAVAPRSVTSAGCSLQKESKKPPALLFARASSSLPTTDGNARGISLIVSRRGGFAASLAFLLPCTWLGARKVSHRASPRETFGAARNLGLMW